MNVYQFSILFCVVFLVAASELIRRQKIAERYSLPWLLLGFTMLVLSVFPGLLNAVSEMIGVAYAPSLLFLLGFLCSLVFILHLTSVMTKMDRKLTRLTQEISLLKARRQGEGEGDEHSADRSV